MAMIEIEDPTMALACQNREPDTSGPRRKKMDDGLGRIQTLPSDTAQGRRGGAMVA